MKKIFKSKFFAISILVAIFLVASIQITSIVVESKYQNSQIVGTHPSAALKIKVTNLKGRPVKNAKVFIAESGKSYVTDDNGYSPVMNVPFVETALTKTVDSDFSMVTITIICKDYIDYILFNCLVYKERMRDGPVITLFNTMESNAPYISTVEIPPDKWTKAFLEQIKKTM